MVSFYFNWEKKFLVGPTKKMLANKLFLFLSFKLDLRSWKLKIKSILNLKFEIWHFSKPSEEIPRSLIDIKVNNQGKNQEKTSHINIKARSKRKCIKATSNDICNFVNCSQTHMCAIRWPPDENKNIAHCSKNWRCKKLYVGPHNSRFFFLCSKFQAFCFPKLCQFFVCLSFVYSQNTNMSKKNSAS